jgi:hypothetical protein
MPAFNCDLDQNNQRVQTNIQAEPVVPMPRQLDSRSFQRQILNDIDTFIFDADGNKIINKIFIHCLN